jgi:hypothetical protein
MFYKKDKDVIFLKDYIFIERPKEREKKHLT